MTKMATMPIYGSNTVNNFFSIISGSFNHCIETQYMYVAMPTQTFHSVFELWPYIALIILMPTSVN